MWTFDIEKLTAKKNFQKKSILLFAVVLAYAEEQYTLNTNTCGKLPVSRVRVEKNLKFEKQTGHR